jgi:hypothetical protein
LFDVRSAFVSGVAYLTRLKESSLPESSHNGGSDGDEPRGWPSLWERLCRDVSSGFSAWAYSDVRALPTLGTDTGR